MWYRTSLRHRDPTVAASVVSSTVVSARVCSPSFYPSLFVSPHCFLVYTLFPAEFREAFGVPLNYKSILQSCFGSIDRSEPLLLLDDHPPETDLTSTNLP